MSKRVTGIKPLFTTEQVKWITEMIRMEVNGKVHRHTEDYHRQSAPPPYNPYINYNSQANSHCAKLIECLHDAYRLMIGWNIQEISPQEFNLHISYKNNVTINVTCTNLTTGICFTQ